MSASQQNDYIFRWNVQGRKGQPCTVTARGALNSILVKFPDGHEMITSRYAVRRKEIDGQA